MNFFLWSAIKDLLLTINNLIKMGMCLPNVCLLCCHEEEFANHILLHCPLANEVWNATLMEVGIDWVFSLSIGELFGGWGMRRVSLKS